MSDVQDRISGSTRRIDGLLDAMARREAERRRAEDAAQTRADAAQAREDSRAPPPVSDALRRLLFSFWHSRPRSLSRASGRALIAAGCSSFCGTSCPAIMSGLTCAPTTFRPAREADRSVGA